MYQISGNTIERIYAGWLGKIIGIRLGAPVEGWSCDKIADIYGEVDDYLVDYRDFAADDDSNGPVFLVRALEDSKKMEKIEPRDVAQALLNYAPYEHAFFWWGGYGISTEHTAYLNLRAGISAPASGSAAMNGKTVAEQIGGQIFSDCWGFVSPGDPRRAAHLAETASSVTHDGNAVYGGQFIAACISLAFLGLSLEEMIEEALEQIPDDCEYSRVVKAVLEFYREHPDSWRACFKYLKENFGYDRYPGNCHVIPNAGVIILSLLYGEDSFGQAVKIAVMCGWDTDCNAGNVGAVMGVRCGVEGISSRKWREPVNDLLICSSVMGSMNITDIPAGAAYFARMAFKMAGVCPEGIWKEVLFGDRRRLHFEYPGSTHGMRIRRDVPEGSEYPGLESWLVNSDEKACTGKRSLKITAKPLHPGEQVFIYQKTYYGKEDLHDNRYDPCFSPLIYPGQILKGKLLVPSGGCECLARMYVKEQHSKKVFYGPGTVCRPDRWESLMFAVPGMEKALLTEAGVALTVLGDTADDCVLEAWMDDMEYGGPADYTLDFNEEKQEMWSGTHSEVTQFTRLKGWTWLEDGRLHLLAADFGETFTGSHEFEDYAVEAVIRPVTGKHHRINVRVQGAVRSYAAGLDGPDSLALLKNENGYRELVRIQYPWKEGHDYWLKVKVEKDVISVYDRNGELFSYRDDTAPYLTGAFGFSAEQGSHGSYSEVKVRPVNQDI